MGRGSWGLTHPGELTAAANGAGETGFTVFCDVATVKLLMLQWLAQAYSNNLPNPMDHKAETKAKQKTERCD